MSSTGEDSGEAKAQGENERLTAERRRWLEAIPPALEPFYPFRAPNQSIPLYRGQLRGEAQASEFFVDGAVEMAWQPTLRLRYRSIEELPTNLSLDVFAGDFDFDLYPADLSVLPVPPEPTDEDDNTPPIEGQLIHLEMGSLDWASFLTFQLPNFLPYVGDWMRHGQHAHRGRIVLSGAGWRLTLDSREGLDQIVSSVKRSGGYALTHVGRLEREDGESFTRDEARKMIDAVYWFCSFVKGSAGGPVLPVGFGPGGKANWSDWRATIAEPGYAADSWADVLHAQELANLFPGFLERWFDPFWQRVVHAGVAYYLDANIPRTLQRAVALAQVGLEMLVYAILIDDQRKTWEEIKPIGRAISGLLDYYKIPITIPDHFTELAVVAAAEGWLTGPWAVTALRNEFIHAKRDAPRRPHEVWVQAWKLISWYLELTLLATLRFNGEYANRLKWPRWVGTVERVPWAQPTSNS